MTPRVICWQDDKLPQGILVKHRHTASLQYSSPHMPLHRRSRSTATHIRHYSHVSYISSSNITAHSEDLTAKEFADIAGIKILPEDDNQSQHNELTVEETHNDQVSLDEECLSVKSSGLSALKPTIMDDAFWRNESASTKSSDEEDIPPLARLLPPLPPQRKVIKKGRFEIHVESAA
ncbi:hypothetical protein BJV82DRAFT_583068 [Fennellomyces sp. T-0311]|nr:hypothetical protein BJV82DRAFT_583068 [Fennellomyces sp. T-0311]